METILFEFGNPEVRVHKAKDHSTKCAETIQGRKLFSGGDYMRKYGLLLLFLESLHVTTYLIKKKAI